VLVGIAPWAHGQSGHTIVDYYGGFVVATRPAFLVDGPEALERRVRHAPKLGWRFGWIAPCELRRLVDGGGSHGGQVGAGDGDGDGGRIEDQDVISCRGSVMWSVCLASAIGAEDARHCDCDVVRLLQCSVVRALLCTLFHMTAMLIIVSHNLSTRHISFLLCINLFPALPSRSRILTRLGRALGNTTYTSSILHLACLSRVFQAVCCFDLLVKS
jgi:hypothetical protein